MAIESQFGSIAAALERPISSALVNAMSSMPSDQNISKFMSYVLRHDPGSIDIALNEAGWCSVSELIEKSQAKYPLNLETLVRIVAEDSKGRYSLSDDNSMIRANQGHSTSSVKLQFPVAVPPTKLFHGTSIRSKDSILKQGLLKMDRHHVHLSADIHTANSVGGRRRAPVVIFQIDTIAMLKAGFRFHLSDNHVWLIDEVPPEFLSVLPDK